MLRHPRFAIVLVPLLVAACVHVPDNEDRRAARIQYDLAVQATHSGRIQEAVADLQTAIDHDPSYAPAHNLLGLLYQLSLGRLKLAETEYLEAMKLEKNYSEAANNLGSLYLQTGKYAKAEKAFRQALKNVLYATPYLARGNLGWALFKQGKADEAINEIQAAILAQPKFCQGYRNLAIIYRSKGEGAKADASVGDFVRRCPDQPEAQYEWGKVRLDAGDAPGARAAFDKCVHLANGGPLADTCGRLLDRVGGPLPRKGASGPDAPDGPDLTIGGGAQGAGAAQPPAASGGPAPGGK